MLDNYELTDRYRRESGRVLMTGTQALPDLTADNRDNLSDHVDRYLELRGFGPVKEHAVENMRASL